MANNEFEEIQHNVFLVLDNNFIPEISFNQSSRDPKCVKIYI